MSKSLQDLELDERYGAKGTVVEHALPADFLDDGDVQQDLEVTAKTYDPAYVT